MIKTKNSGVITIKNIVLAKVDVVNKLKIFQFLSSFLGSQNVHKLKYKIK